MLKKQISKTAREKGQITYKGNPIRLTVDFSSETLQARKDWGLFSAFLKKKKIQLRISYSAKLSFISKREIRSFSDRQMLREFVNIRPALQEFWKGVLTIRRKDWVTSHYKDTLKYTD